jgi:chromosome segregation protein SMC, common bacterial type
MHLHKIKLAGFKSFVDPTTLYFPSNLVGIVGPNGCGKSNVIDAVRWVMGESSAKHLRGDSMTDVIFNGSSARKPVGQAFVELIFDNADGALGGQYARYSEISVKRQVARDGQSAYFLNGTRCRRRDITDVFLGTGLGSRSYAIIEQGMISRLIEARPEELRAHLEEAAGISKYKERRRETENRIYHTQENLTRLADLREELQKQLKHLERQAGAAEKYKTLREEERRLKAGWLALRLRSLDEDLMERDREVSAQGTAVEEAVAKQRANEAAIERAREQHVSASEVFNEVQGRHYQVGAELMRIEQAIQHGKELKRRQQQDLAETEGAWEEVQRHIEQDDERLRVLEALLKEKEPALEDAQAREQAACAKLHDCEKVLAHWQARWDEFNRRAAEPAQIAEVERTRMDHLERQTLKLEERLYRSDQERLALSNHQLEGEINELLDQEVRLAQNIQALKEVLEQVKGRSAALYDAIGEQEAGLEASWVHLQAIRDRLVSLEAIQQAALGKSDGAVGVWLAQQGIEHAPRLAKHLDVEAGWERAVETVLGLHLEAVCLDNLEAALGGLGEFRAGALTLFDTSVQACAGSTAGLTTPLLNKVRAPWPLEILLNGVYITEGVVEALALRYRLESHESVVTRDGVWLGRGWLRISREADGKAGVLALEQEIRSLHADKGQASEEAATRREVLDRSRTEARALEAEREAIQGELHTKQRYHAEIKGQVSGEQGRLEQIRAREKQLGSELEAIRSELDYSGAELKAAEGRLQQALARSGQFEEEREALERQREYLRADLSDAQHELQLLRDTRHEITLALESTRTERNATQQNLTRMQGQLASLKKRRADLRTALEAGEAPLNALGVKLEQLLAERAKLEGELHKARLGLAEAEGRVRILEQGRHVAEQQAEEIRGKLGETRLAAGELRVRRQTLLEQMVTTGFEYSTVLKTLPEDARAQDWEDRISAVAERIERLGPINLVAIDEFKALAERKKYLDSQHADLSEALVTLERAIGKIDGETKMRFKETFDQVNAGLNQMFPRLFGNGHAYLELIGEDLLSAGVAVMARPPGKRISTIHLLSGGEKALTAVALVFALFELNPAPFCMLDEVDAPLDDANIGRFCDLVREMSARIQFIFITHNKSTMEMAYHLTGVTMSEAGISRLVAVDVDEAVRMVG